MQYENAENTSFRKQEGLVHARSRSSIDQLLLGDNHGDRVIADALAAKLQKHRQSED